MQLYRIPLASSQVVRFAPILLLAILFCGCSNKANTLTGNERLARGPGGLGTTIVEAPDVDLDTYVTQGTADYAGTLLTGRSSSYEAKALFKFLSYSLPNETLPGFQAGDVLFQLDQSPLRSSPAVLDLDFGLTDAALGDSGTISWPGPGIGTPLASIAYDFVGPLLVSLGPGSYTVFKQWAANPSAVPGFILRSPLTQGIAGFRGRNARFRVPYTWVSGTTIIADTINTVVPLDLYLHPPLSPPATGADTSLVLGGPFEATLALRAPVPPIPPGASVNELRLVLAVTDSVPAVDGSILNNTIDSTRIAVTVIINQITAPWPENATDLSTIAFSLSPLRTIIQVAVEPGDSLSLALPTSLARGWSANPATNNGVLISIFGAGTSPGIRIASRESSRSPVLRVSTTSPPPGRF